MISAAAFKKVEARALEIWRERERTMPERVRRMNPDALDYASGAWWACMVKAGLELRIIEEV